MVEKLLDIQMSFGETNFAYVDLEYCIDVIAKGKLYKLQHELLMDENSSEEDDDEEDPEERRDSAVSVLSRSGMHNDSALQLSEVGDKSPGIQKLAATINTSLEVDK